MFLRNTFFMSLKQLKLRNFAGLFIIYLLRTIPVQAQEMCLLVPAPLAQRVGQATVILEAKVTAQESFWDVNRHNIYTRNKLRVYKIFKGDLAVATQAEIITEGGAVDNKIHVFSNSLALQIGQQGIFFLEPSRLAAANQALDNQPVYSVYSSQQGFIQYQLPHLSARDPFRNYSSISRNLYPALQAFPEIKMRTVQENPDLNKGKTGMAPAAHRAARTYGIPAISDFSPDSITAGTGEILTIRGQNFGAARGTGQVEFPNANDGGSSYISPLDSDYILWRDDMIQVKVPSLASSGSGVAGNGQIRVTNSDPKTITSTASLNVVYAFTNVLRDDQAYRPYHTNTDQNGGYTLQFGSNVSAAARSALMRAMQTWTCNTAMNWRAGSTATVNGPADDKVNLVRFAPPADLPDNVLGRTISRYEGCRLGTSQSYWVSEFDFEFNTMVPWQFGPAPVTAVQYDFETTTLHELGHAIQLAHLIQPRAVMHYSIGRSQVTRTLSGRNDVDGGARLVAGGFSSNLCGPSRMVPLISADCLLSPPLTAFEAVLRPNGSVTLNWTITSENSLVFYSLERSTTGIKWQELARLPATGQGNYTATDSRPNQGFTYYRLRLLNRTGQYSYSPVRRVGSEDDLAANIQLFPNPVLNNTLHFTYFAPADGPSLVGIYDFIGREFTLLKRNVSHGNNPFYFDITNLDKGGYILQVIQDNKIERAKFIKY
jgi:hypothetical protein